VNGRVPLACQLDLRSRDVDANRIASPLKRGSCDVPSACCNIENVRSSLNARIVEQDVDGLGGDDRQMFVVPGDDIGILPARALEIGK
jgi:hypothetical protein